MFGVENIKKILFLVIEAGNMADKMAKAANAMQRLGHIAMITDELMVVTTADFASLKNEFLDLDAAERADILQATKDKFDIADDELEATVEEALDLAVEGVAYGTKVVAFGKRIAG